MGRERLSSSSREPKRPSRTRLWLRRSRGLLRPVALGVGGAAALGALGYAVWVADPAGRVLRLAESLSTLGGQTGMTVQEVLVEGRRNTPIDMIRAALGVTRGDPILAFSPAAAKARLETIPWVQHANVERHLPGTIVLRIEERRPFAIWQHNARFVIIDRDGRVVASDGLDQFGPLPLLVGAGADHAGAALYDLLAAEPDIAQRVQAMVRIAERRWNLRLHNGTDVMLPDGAEAAAIQRLAELQREARLLDRPVAAIDLRLPDRLVVRTQRTPEPEAQQPPTPRQARNTRG